MLDESLYWDTSALVSLLTEDLHSRHAIAARTPRYRHCISSLTVSEVFAVIYRTKAHGYINVAQQFLQEIREGFWTLLHAHPEANLLMTLAAKHSLRGADLWHLAAAHGLHAEIPELRVITFDEQLARACREEGLLFTTPRTRAEHS